MNLKQLEIFVRVAELGSFSKAAQVLAIAQPALSRQIRLLETDLRMTLLQRTGRGVVLTDAGKRLFDHSIGILQLVDHARDDLEANRDTPVGRVVLGLPPSLSRALTLPLVDTFRRDLPRAQLAIVEGLSTHVAEWIATGQIDAGLLYTQGNEPGIETTPILDEPLCLVSAATTHAANTGVTADALESQADIPSSGDTLSFAQLPNYPLILPERSHAIRKVVEARAALSGIKPMISLEISSVQSILDLVRAGYGHAILTPGSVLASGQQEAFVVRPLTDPPMHITLGIGVSAHKPMTPLIRHAAVVLRSLLMSRAAARLNP